jgi:hypothetical protein
MNIAFQFPPAHMGQNQEAFKYGIFFHKIIQVIENGIFFTSFYMIRKVF